MKLQLQIDVDPEADAAYVTIDDAAVTQTRELDRYRILDLDSAGRVVGIELLRVSSGVSLEGLPFAKELAPLLATSNITAW